MPTYVYETVLPDGSGGERFERVEPMAAASLERHPDTGVPVRRVITGFAIGGIPPIGHATPLVTLIDRDLLAHATVYAAAGTPNAVFAVDPRELARATRAEVVAVTEAQ